MYSWYLIVFNFSILLKFYISLVWVFLSFTVSIILNIDDLHFNKFQIIDLHDSLVKAKYLDKLPHGITSMVILPNW